MSVLDREECRINLTGADQKRSIGDALHLADVLDAVALLLREIAEERMVGLHRENLVHVVLLRDRDGRAQCTGISPPEDALDETRRAQSRGGLCLRGTDAWRQRRRRGAPDEERGRGLRGCLRNRSFVLELAVAVS